MNELIKKLKQYNILTNEWGTKNTKTLEHLSNEINKKECLLIEEDNKLVRYIQFVGIQVYYKDLHLKEYEQIFNDGRKRKRSMKSSVSEKMVPGENPIEAAIRGISEELGITIPKEQLQELVEVSFNKESESYPGLLTKYKGYQFKCNLTKKQYNPDGYIEKQPDKHTYFKWFKK